MRHKHELSSTMHIKKKTPKKKLEVLQEYVISAMIKQQITRK